MIDFFNTIDDTGIYVNKTDGISDPQAYIIEDILFVMSDGKTISLKPSLLELSIYEDLFSPTTTGYVAVTDSSGFIEAFNISGFNFINISFAKTSRDDKNSFERIFRVYKIGKTNQNSRSNEDYSIYFCSEELFISEQVRVGKSYVNQTIDYIIQDIMTDDRGLKSQRIGVLEPTEGVYNFIVPNLKPFDAITWLSTYARPKKSNFEFKGADMIFFETKDGYNFRSLQSIYKDPVYKEYHYSPQNVYMSSDRQELAYGLQSMLTCKIINHFDTLAGVSNGLFANKILTVDPLTRSASYSEFKYDEYVKKGVSLNPYPLTSNYTNRFDKGVSDTTNAVLNVAVGNRLHKRYATIKSDRKALDSVAPDIAIETFVPFRTAQIGLANYIKVEFGVPGDPGLNVGSIVKLNIPSLAVKRNVNDKNLNQYYSGKYVVSAVRHKLDIRGVYQCVVEAITDSVSAPNISFVDNETTRKVKEA